MVYLNVLLDLLALYVTVGIQGKSFVFQANGILLRRMLFCSFKQPCFLVISQLKWFQFVGLCFTKVHVIISCYLA